MAVYKTKVICVSEIAKGTFEVRLKRPKDFFFEAGQYIQLKIPKLKYADYKGNSRVFSLASSPNEKNFLSVAFRNTQSGYKKTLIEMDKGKKEVLIEGPYGFFTLPEKKDKNLVFIAGGIGITPFLSMIKLCHESKNGYKITLVYCNKDKESSAYLEELEKIAKENKNFSLICHFGRLNVDLIKKNLPNIKSDFCYIVGPPAMMDAAEQILLSVGVEKDNILKEGFVGY